MSAWHPKVGECLLIDSGPIGKHLFVLVLDKQINNKVHILSVPICTVRESARIDESCIIQPGEHSFIKDESFVEYRNSRVDPVDSLLERVNEMTFIPHDSVTKELLAKIIYGLKTSKEVKRYIKDDFI
jgi:hypothetical protein